MWRMPGLWTEVKDGVAAEMTATLKVGSGLLFRPWEPPGGKTVLVREEVWLPMLSGEALAIERSIVQSCFRETCNRARLLGHGT